MRCLQLGSSILCASAYDTVPHFSHLLLPRVLHSFNPHHPAGQTRPGTAGEGQGISMKAADYKIGDRVKVQMRGDRSARLGTIIGHGIKYPNTVRIHMDGASPRSIDNYHEDFLRLIPQTAVRFDGPDLTEADDRRLSTQLLRVQEALADGNWWTLAELARMAGSSEAGASARLRDLRKARFGRHTVERRRVRAGLWEYRLVG